MSTPRYASLGTLRQYLSAGGALGTTDNALLTNCLVRAERQIDDYTRRVFVAEPGTSYYGWAEAERARGKALWLDRDLYRLQALYNGDGGTIPVGSVWTEPRNEGPPYRILRLMSGYAWTWSTDRDVIVVGTWGYSLTPPASIVQATVRLAAHLYRQKDVGVTDVAGFEAGGEVTYAGGMPRDVMWLLSPFRSRTGGMW